MVDGSDTSYSVYLNTKKCATNTTMSNIKYLSDVFILDQENKININNDNYGFKLSYNLLCPFITNFTSYITNDNLYNKFSVLRVILDQDTSIFMDIISPYENIFIPLIVDCRRSYNAIHPFETFPFYGFKISCIMNTYEYTPYENEITPD